MLLLKLLLVLTFSTTLIAQEDHQFIKCSTRPCERASKGKPSPRIAALLVGKEEAASTSTNWSGYVAGLNLSGKPVANSVTYVAGSWIVPNLQASAVDTSCSVWVGIDGYGSPSVEQLGTEHDVKGGVVSHYAWYEMFPLPSQLLEGFPVASGDQISASVIYIPLSGVLQPNSDLFILQIFNNTQRLYTSIPYITVSHMQRVCAEWIVEAPWLNVTLPLSHFSPISVFNCSCTVNGVSGSISNPAWSNVSLNMVDSSGQVKAVTSALSADGKSFSVSWQHN